MLVCSGAVTRLDYDEDFEEEGEAKVKKLFQFICLLLFEATFTSFF